MNGEPNNESQSTITQLTSETYRQIFLEHNYMVESDDPIASFVLCLCSQCDTYRALVGSIHVLFANAEAMRGEITVNEAIEAAKELFRAMRSEPTDQQQNAQNN